MKTEILIVGCGVAGLYCALNLPTDKNIIIITKDEAENSNSYLAQGGICTLRDENDYQSFFDDTLKAGHHENNCESVDIMIRGSNEVVDDLVDFGVRFAKDGDNFAYTKEGAHSKPRILFHEDETGKEITSHLLAEVKARKNITLIENLAMVDLVSDNNVCYGIVAQDKQGKVFNITADYTVLATGGIGGLFKHSTNFRHLTGDSIALALLHGIKLKNLDYIQIHPTVLYSKKQGREFLISESVRGEGAILLNSKGERFVNELLPRDMVTKAIFAEMQKEGTEHVWLLLTPIPKEKIKTRFPNIYNRCLEEGYDVTKDAIPVVPSQHYFMGGIEVDTFSKTSMERLYAVGETACNGVHGKNRLASNSLLESMVFAKRAAINIMNGFNAHNNHFETDIDATVYANCKEQYKNAVLAAIEKEKKSHE